MAGSKRRSMRHASANSAMPGHTPARWPASHAAPRAVVSITTGRSTGAPSWSASACIVQSDATMPPSTRSTALARVGIVRPHGLDEVARLVAHRFQRRAGELGPARAAREAVDGAASVRVPIGRAQAREGGHEIDRLLGVRAVGQRVRLGRLVDDAQLVPQPLQPPRPPRRSSPRDHTSPGRPAGSTGSRAAGWRTGCGWRRC